MTTLSPLKNRVFILNFFEKSEISDEDFFRIWKDAADYGATKEHCLSIHLHKGIGINTKFPWVNFAAFDSNDVCVFGKPDEIWAGKMKAIAESKIIAHPGEYYEIASYKGNALTTDDKKRPETSRFLLTALKADESISKQDIESNWKEWMKTDFIHQKLKGNNNLGDSMLYRMEKCINPLIRYAVRTEISEIDELEGMGLAEQVNQQNNREGMETFTGFYRVYINL